MRKKKATEAFDGGLLLGDIDHLVSYLERPKASLAELDTLANNLAKGLHKLAVLTAGDRFPYGHATHPDGRQSLFNRSYSELWQRPSFWRRRAGQR